MRLHHGGQPDGISESVFARQGSQDLLRFEGIHGEDIAHRDLLDRLIRQLRHDLSHLLEHAPHIGARLRLNFHQRGDLIRTCSMMASAPSSIWTCTLAGSCR